MTWTVTHLSVERRVSNSEYLRNRSGLNQAIPGKRRPGDEYSTVSAAAVGTTPPNPRPPTTRATTSHVGVGASAAAAVIAENSATLPSSIRRRPTMSLNVPAPIAPIIMPASEQLAIAPSWSCNKDQSVPCVSMGSTAP
ncbi:hypothetical protein P5W99_26030 [Paraburkholderia sp. A3BS-1L]